jgi:hypothetical protein
MKFYLTSHCKYHGTLAVLTQIILFVKMLEFFQKKLKEFSFVKENKGSYGIFFFLLTWNLKKYIIIQQIRVEAALVLFKSISNKSIFTPIKIRKFWEFKYSVERL